MFIIKFNNMVKNKWVWFIFAVIVCVAFGASDMLATSGRSDTGSSPLGTLNGEDVDSRLYDCLYRVAQQDARAFSFGGEAPNPTPRAVWKLLAAVKRAEALGLTVSDAELGEMIVNDPTFRGQTGTFDKNVYAFVLREQLSVTPVQYQEMLRYRILMARLEFLVSQGPWVPPSVVSDRTHGATDSYTIQTATISNRFANAASVLKAEQVKTFFENNKEAYRVEDQRRVEYVVFAAKDYLDKTTVDEDMILEYYDDNADKYTTKDAEGKEVVKELETVRAEIEKELAEEQARDLAYRAAGEFSDIFYNLSDEKVAAQGITFTNEAAKAGYKVLTSKLFTRSTAPVVYQEATAFSDSVFDLTTDYFSGSVTDAIGGNGGNEAYVAHLLEVVPSYIPELKDIEKRVTKDAIRDQSEIDFQKDLTTARDTFVREMAAGKDFADIAASLNMTVSTNLVMSFVEASSAKFKDIPYASRIAQQMTGMSVGDVSSDAIVVPNGAMFFVVKDRKAVDQAALLGMEQNVQRAMAREYGSAVWEEWLEKNLDEMNPLPAEPFDSEDEEDDEDADEE